MSTATIRGLLAQIESQCDLIDSQSPTNPTPPATVIDCLAGTNPGWGSVNMYTDELNETAWINKRSTYRTTMKDSPSGSVLCLGDSMIERMTVSSINSKCINLGISGESIRQLLYRVNETDINNQPNLIHRAGGVVMLTGVNDLSDIRNGSPINAALTVEQVYEKLKGWLTGKLIICKLIPVDSAVFSVPTNASIAHVNDWIQTNFGSLPNVRIVDVNAILAPNGSLLPQYHIDGQHLSTAGYDILYDDIEQAGVELQMWS